MIPRLFLVTLQGNRQVTVEPWFVPQLRRPKKLDDLEPWCKAPGDKDPARPNDPYTLELAPGVSMNDFSTASTVFSSRGFVHPVARVVGGEEVDLYHGYVPADAARPVGTSLVTLNLVLEPDAIYVTVVEMLDEWRHVMRDDRKFEPAVLEQGALGPLGLHLKDICSQPRRPCDRIYLRGLGDTSMAPALKLLRVVRQLFPGRIPGVTFGPTFKPGSGARLRDRGETDFLRLEGLIQRVE